MTDSSGGRQDRYDPGKKAKHEHGIHNGEAEGTLMWAANVVRSDSANAIGSAANF